MPRWNKPAAERFWDKVALWDDCWIWIGAKNHLGYGHFRLNGPMVKAHHFLLPPIPAGMQCDHLCRNRACVKPSHIEIVTSKENTLRGASCMAVNARKAHCPSGHRYDLITSQGRRGCRRCAQAATRKGYLKARSRVTQGGAAPQAVNSRQVTGRIIAHHEVHRHYKRPERSR